ncbi:putative porin [Ekhidna sp.]|uniref:putative porin n=1 Tax=Ekhidna sp. TaxID=2608089 RepID=UPI003299C11C
MRILVIFFSCITMFFGHKTIAQNKTSNKLNLFADFRFRTEQDWDSRNFDGTSREDRFRLRYRLRFGFEYDYDKNISFGARLRTGVNETLQSPHNNFGHQEFTGVPINFDRIFLRGDYDKFWWLVGKDNLPFWKQNELFWDDDVTPEGVATGANLQVKKLTLKPKIGFFITNTGNGDFDPRDPTNGMIDGSMIAGQLEANLKVKNIEVKAATSLFKLKDVNNVPTTDFFFSGNRFKIDYSLLFSSIQLNIPTKHPIKIGVDHFINLEDYSDYPDSLINSVYQDQNQGFVFSLLVGSLNKKKGWLLGYYYAHKEEFSVVSYYTEDDWIRLGNINRNRNTNYKGHEIRVGYSFSETFNILARTYLVNGLVSPQAVTENGKRFRIDLNIKFKNSIQF